MYTRGLLSGSSGIIADEQQTNYTVWSSQKTQEQIDAGGGGGGTGDVVGPSSSTTNAIARFANTTGKLLGNSGVTVAANSGSAAAPALAFPSATTTGVYLASVGLGPSPAVGLAAEGNAVLVAANDRIAANRTILAADGSVASPSYAFGTNTSTGVCYDGASVGLTANSAKVLGTGAGRVYTAPISSLADAALELPKGATITPQGTFDPPYTVADINIVAPLLPGGTVCGFVFSDYGTQKYVQASIPVYSASIFSTNVEERGIEMPVAFCDRVQLKVDRADNSAFSIDWGDVVYASEGRQNGISYVQSGGTATGEIRIYEAGSERLRIDPLITRLLGPPGGALLDVTANDIEVTHPILSQVAPGAAALRATGGSSGQGFGFDNIGNPILLSGGGTPLAWKASSSSPAGEGNVTIYDRSLKVEGVSGVQTIGFETGNHTLTYQGGTQQYVLDDAPTPASVLATQITYNPIPGRPVLYTTAIATDGNVYVLANVDDDITNPNGLLAYAFGPSDACNGIDVPASIGTSAALEVSMVINSARVTRHTAGGFQIMAGKTLSLDSGVNTMSGIIKGRTAWAPTVGTLSGTNFTLSSAAGNYQVVGQCVTFACSFTVSNKNGLTTQNIKMSLPYGTVSTAAYLNFNSAASGFVSLTGTSTTFNLLCLVAQTNGKFTYQSHNAGTTTELDLLANNMITGQPYYVSGVYFI